VNRLLYWARWDRIRAAIAREKQIKGWSRAKKFALDGVEESRLEGFG